VTFSDLDVKEHSLDSEGGRLSRRFAEGDNLSHLPQARSRLRASWDLDRAGSTSGISKAMGKRTQTSRGYRWKTKRKRNPG